MLAEDDPQHAATRAPMNPVMRPRGIDSWTEVFERNAHTYADRMHDIGPDHADLNRDYAAPLAAKNLVDLLGIDGVSARGYAPLVVLFHRGDVQLGRGCGHLRSSRTRS